MLFLNLASAVAAVLAAVLWFASTRVKLPSTFSSPYGAPPPELEDLNFGLAKQSRLNAGAAICAGVAALCQSAIFTLPIIESLGC